MSDEAYRGLKDAHIYNSYRELQPYRKIMIYSSRPLRVTLQGTAVFAAFSSSSSPMEEAPQAAPAEECWGLTALASGTQDRPDSLVSLPPGSSDLFQNSPTNWGHFRSNTEQEPSCSSLYLDQYP